MGSLAFTACGDDNETPAPSEENKNAEGENATNNDLVGTWEAKGEQVKSVYIFTNDKLTIENYYFNYQENTWKLDESASFEGSYTLKDGILSYVTTYKYYDQQEQKEKEASKTVEVVAKLLYNKTALVLLTTMRNEEFVDYTVSQILYKKGATIPAKLDDIQGDWRWYMNGDVTNTRVAVQISGDKMKLIIVAWGQRYDGTITYENGYINFTVEKGYTSRGNSQGEGWGEGDLNPETLEGNWTELDSNSWMYYHLKDMPFIANGKEAYGILANLPGVYYKK